MAFSQREFRNALGSFPTGVTVVTTRTSNGQDVGVTANSFNSVSLDPPLVLWSLDRAAYSWRVFSVAPHFAINVLSEGQSRLSRHFSRARAGKWSTVAFERWSTGCPVLLGCVANLECERHAAHDGGDHQIIVGRVLGLHNDPKAMPLVFHHGQYRRIEVDRG
jgi:flavin reductase (DIM6/NTAB) family NADH-FMN oxidoreductase RutF